MFFVITYEVTNQPSAQAGGFATAHHNAPETCDFASTKACSAPTLSPVTAPHEQDVPSTYPVVDECRTGG